MADPAAAQAEATAAAPDAAVAGDPSAPVPESSGVAEETKQSTETTPAGGGAPAAHDVVSAADVKPEVGDAAAAAPTDGLLDANKRASVKFAPQEAKDGGGDESDEDEDLIAAYAAERRAKGHGSRFSQSVSLMVLGDPKAMDMLNAKVRLNLTLAMRRRAGTKEDNVLSILQLAIFCLLMGILIWVKSTSDVREVPQQAMAFGAKNVLGSNPLKKTIFVAPCTANSTGTTITCPASEPACTIMEFLAASDDGAVWLADGFLKCAPSQAAIEEWGAQNPGELDAGVVFHNPSDISDPTKTVSYTIHQNRTTLVDLGQGHLFAPKTEVPNNSTLMWATQPRANTPFVTLQLAVDNAIIKARAPATPKPTLTSVALHHFAVPAYLDTTSLQIISDLLPTVLVLTLTNTLTGVIIAVMEEKQQGFKNNFFLAGMTRVVLGVSWAITGLLNSLFYLVLIMLALFAGRIFEDSDFFIVLIFLVLTFANTIVCALFFTTIFSKVTTASVFGLITFIATSFPALSVRSASVASGVTVLSCLLPPTAMALGIDVLMISERKHGGMTWDTVNRTEHTDIFGISMGQVLGMLALDLIVYWVLFWYLDATFTHGGGNLSWDFCFKLDYWFPNRVSGAWTQPEPDMPAETARRASTWAHGFDPNKSDAVEAADLSKVFKSPVGDIHAVDGLTLNLKENEITAVLGHNGSGKTTTINLLTGTLRPTSGDATMYGHSIVKNPDRVRKLVGVCPQKNVLYPYITVIEHLVFYAYLKGIPTQQVEKVVKQKLKEVGLDSKSDSQVRNLSGGMARRLSVAIALLGDPRVIFLDEPTAGVDPFSRRALWDMFISLRKNRVILFTTHFMDEADILGDKIVVLSKGHVQVSGSSMYLKKAFGIGYTLTIDPCIDCDDDGVALLVDDSIEGAEFIPADEGNATISFVLPFESVPEFAQLFRRIDEEADELGINAYGLSVPTLQEVFLQLAIDEKEGEGETQVDLDMAGTRSNMVTARRMSSMAGETARRGSSMLPPSSRRKQSAMAGGKPHRQSISRGSLLAGNPAVRQPVVSGLRPSLLDAAVLKEVDAAAEEETGRRFSISSAQMNELQAYAQALQEERDRDRKETDPSQEGDVSTFGGSISESQARRTSGMSAEGGSHGAAGSVTGSEAGTPLVDTPSRPPRRRSVKNKRRSSKMVLPSEFKARVQAAEGLGSQEAVELGQGFVPLDVSATHVRNRRGSSGPPVRRGSLFGAKQRGGKRGSKVGGPSISRGSMIRPGGGPSSRPGSGVAAPGTSGVFADVRHLGKQSFAVQQRMMAAAAARGDGSPAGGRSSVSKSLGSLGEDEDAQRAIQEEGSGSSSADDSVLGSDGEIKGAEKAKADSAEGGGDKQKRKSKKKEKKKGRGGKKTMAERVAAQNKKKKADVKWAEGGFHPTASKQAQAMATKRFLLLRRDFRAFMYQSLLPGIMIAVIGLIVALGNEVGSDGDPTIWLTSSAFDGIPSPPAKVGFLVDNAAGAENGAMYERLAAPGMGYEIVNGTTIASIKDDTDGRIGALRLDTLASGPGTNTWRVYFQMQVVNALPALVSMASQTSLKASVAGTPEQAIRTGYTPLPLNEWEKRREGSSFSTAIIMTISIVMAFANIAATQTVTIVREAESRFKRAQMLAGLKPWVFHIGNFVYDMALFLIPWLLCVATIAIADFKVFSDHMGAFTVFILLYGVANCPYSYFLSFLFSRASAAQNLMTVTGSIVPLVIGGLYTWFDIEDNAQASQVIQYVGFLFPGNVLAIGLINLSLKGVCETEASCAEIDGFDMDLLGLPMLVFVSQTLIYFMLTFALENQPDHAKKEYEKSIRGTEDEQKIRCTPAGPIGEKSRAIITSALFTKGITIVILLNIITILMDTDSTPEGMAQALDILNYIFSGIFMLEMAVKLAGLGPVGYFRNAFNVFDATLVLFSIVEIILAGTGALSAARGAKAARAGKLARAAKFLRLLRLLRVFRVFRLVRTVERGPEQVGSAQTALFSCVGGEVSEGPGVTDERYRIENIGDPEGGAGPAKMNTAATVAGRKVSRSMAAHRMDNVRVINMRKVFRTATQLEDEGVVAIEDMCLGIRAGECLGLLGPNGAGKSSALGVITGSAPPTSGKVKILDSNVTTQLDEVVDKIGFCPQFDALPDLLSGRETLHMYATIKGVNPEGQESLVDSLIEQTLLTDHADKLVTTYSGGNKRKLSIALALIGSPKILFLDEPSTGMDPVAAQSIWNVIWSWTAGDLSRSLVLTTHSMEEADSLCARIGILVNGKFGCLGSSQELKNRYGEGYQIELRLAERNAGKKRVLEMVRKVAPSVKELESYGKQLKLELKPDEASLDKLFAKLQKSRERYGIEDYSVSQTTLEQVFIRFARMQVAR